MKSKRRKTPLRKYSKKIFTRGLLGAKKGASMATKVVKKAVRFDSEPMGGLHLLLCKLAGQVVAKTLKICLKKGKLPKIKYLRKTFRASLSCFGLPMVTLFVITHLASRLFSEEAVRPVKLMFICFKVLSTIYPETNQFFED